MQFVQSDYVVDLVAGCRIPLRCERVADGRRLADAVVPKQRRRQGDLCARLLFQGSPIEQSAQGHCTMPLIAHPDLRRDGDLISVHAKRAPGSSIS